jgi:RNA polymerase-binding transcription factor DksA
MQVPEDIAQLQPHSAMPAKPKPAKKASKPAKSGASKAPAKKANQAAVKKVAPKATSKKSPPKAAKPAKASKPVAKSKPDAKAKSAPKPASKGKAPAKKPVPVKKSPPVKTAKKTPPVKAAKPATKSAAKPAKPSKPAPAAKVTKPAAAEKKAAPKAAKTEEKVVKPAPAPAPAPAAKSTAKDAKSGKDAKSSKDGKKSGSTTAPMGGSFNVGGHIKSVSRSSTEEVGATIDVPRVVKVTPFLKRQKQRLIELRSMLLDQMDSVAEGSLRVRPEGSEASAFGMHQADAGSDAYDRDFALSLLSQEQDSLYEINEALKRIDMGTYGICEMSGKQIPEIRLEALPFTRFTVECQAQIERQNMGGRFRRPVRSLFGLDEAADDSGDDSDEESEPVDKNAE